MDSPAFIIVPALLTSIAGKDVIPSLISLYEGLRRLLSIFTAAGISKETFEYHQPLYVIIRANSGTGTQVSGVWI